jgi:exopolyphosphatase/guanosine-5'-triphosphate,3'-diphosphate pyrophosphatase
VAGAKVAVVDMGTNSVRLLLAAVEDGRVRDVERLTTVTRLGAGVDERRRLDAAAAARTRACLAGYATRIAAFAPDAGQLVATSVLRDAGDGPEFLATAAAELDVPARVLGGEEEAALTFAGALSGCDAPGEEMGTAGGPPGVAASPGSRRATVVIDIGGGSVELAVGTRRRAQPAEPSFVCSLDVGVVRLTERFFASDPPDDDQWRVARDFVRAALAAALPPELCRSVGEGIGLAGTFTTLVAHKLALRTYDRAAVHGHVLTRSDIAAAQAAFRRLPSAARGLLPGIQPGREDVILAGALLADEMCRAFDLDAVRVSEADLLDGVALSLAGPTMTGRPRGSLYGSGSHPR